MHASRTQGRLISFAVSAMLTSAVLATAPDIGIVTAATVQPPTAVLSMIDGARSGVFAGSKDVPDAAAVASPSAILAVKHTATAETGLTPAQLAKLRKLALGPDGHEGNLRVSIAKALALTTADQPVFLRSFSADDPDTKVTFQILLLPNNSGYVIVRGDEQTVRAFRLDADLHLVGAVTGPAHIDTVTPIPTAEAKKLCDADKTTMGEIADALGMA